MLFNSSSWIRGLTFFGDHLSPVRILPTGDEKFAGVFCRFFPRAHDLFPGLSYMVESPPWFFLSVLTLRTFIPIYRLEYVDPHGERPE